MKRLLASLNYEQARMAAFCSATILIAGLISYGLIPQLRMQYAMTAQITTLERKLQGPVVTQADLDALDQENAGLQAALSGGEREVAPRKIESRVLKQLHRQAEQAGVRLAQVTPERQKIDSAVMALQFDVEAIGSYSASAQWLELLDSADMETVLASFAMAPEDEQGRKLRTRVRILSYHLTAEAA